MARALRRGWVARVLAATLSLTLVVVSAAGSAAHASDHSHHHGAGAQDADHSPAGKHPQAAAANDVDGDAASADVPEPRLQHQGCMDFICHGGVAILAMAAGWHPAVWREVRGPCAHSDALASLSPAALERPPKSLRSA